GSRERNERGTVYVVSVSGAKMYQMEPREWMQSKAADTQLYQLIRVDGSQLAYESRTARGDLFDAFTLHKRADGGNDLIEGEVPPPWTGEPAAPPGREPWNAAAAVVIGASVLLGGRVALKKPRENGKATGPGGGHLG